MIVFDRATCIPEFTEASKARFKHLESPDLALDSDEAEEITKLGAFLGSTIFANTKFGDLDLTFGRSTSDGEDTERYYTARSRLSFLIVDWCADAYIAAMQGAEAAVIEEITANRGATL